MFRGISMLVTSKFPKSQLGLYSKHPLWIGHVRCINIQVRLPGFWVKIENISIFFCPSIPKRDLDAKKTNIDIWPISLGAMLEYWYTVYRTWPIDSNTVLCIILSVVSQNIRLVHVLLNTCTWIMQCKSFHWLTHHGYTCTLYYLITNTCSWN